MLDMDELAETQAVKPTVVLVHGALADGASWNPVAALLQACGYPVVVVLNRLCSVADDVASLRALLHAVDGSVVLVGHAYGGVLISNAVHESHDVEALVFVAGLAPEAGENIAFLTEKYPGAALEDVLSAPLITECEAGVYVASNHPGAEPAWKQLPNWFVYGDADEVLPPSLHAFLAERAGAVEAVVVRGGSHALMVSRPDAVLKTIEMAVAATIAQVPNIDAD